MPSIDPRPRHPTRRVILRPDGPLWRLSIDGVPHSAHLGEAEALQRACELARQVGGDLLVVPREPTATRVA
jgi:hypothetical protein